jgi:hypothetical protein
MISDITPLQFLRDGPLPADKAYVFVRGTTQQEMWTFEACMDRPEDATWADLRLIARVFRSDMEFAPLLVTTAVEEMMQ